jgi:hypothetical protein
MKLKTVLLILLVQMTINSFSQEIKKPSDGKTLVYFVRYQGAIALIDFKYYDGEKYLGQGSGNNYFIYECDPGDHLFWVNAENREFIKGNLKPNATYIVEVRPFFRAVMSGVELYQITPSDKKALKKIYKLIDNKEPTELKKSDSDMTEKIVLGMERYEAIKDKVKVMNPDSSF